MTEYTPSDREVREGYAFSAWVQALAGANPTDVERSEQVAEFDRWLAAHDAEKWDEGWRRGFGLPDHAHVPRGVNPYRALGEKGDN